MCTNKIQLLNYILVNEKYRNRMWFGFDKYTCFLPVNERVVIYNLKTHADDGLLITWSSDNINTCSGGADKPSLRFQGVGMV